jgi:hypothetical protein
MNRANRPRLSRISGSSVASKLMSRAPDATSGYNERFDGGNATTTAYPYRVDGRDAEFTLYSSVINGGQANNP